MIKIYKIEEEILMDIIKEAFIEGYDCNSSNLKVESTEYVVKKTAQIQHAIGKSAIEALEG